MPASPTSEINEAPPGSAMGPVKRVKRAEDTVAGCEALAASDLSRAAATDTSNGRLRFQHSAAAWQARADMLQRMATSFAKRKALDAAEREWAADARTQDGSPDKG